MPARKPKPAADPLDALAHALARLSPAELARFTERLTPDDLETIELALGQTVGADHYFPEARDKQRPPSGLWLIWLIMAGRGFGKTRTGAEWTVDKALTDPGPYAVIGPTFADGRDICIEGRGDDGKPSGVLSVLERRGRADYTWNRSMGELVLDNGALLKVLSGEQPERVRGWNFRGGWCVAEGEMVETEAGPRPIEDVRRGDHVWTRAGLRRVLAARCTSTDRELVEVRAGGFSLRCTPDHRIWTHRGWIRAADVIPSDRLSAWNHSLLARPPGSNGAVRAGIAMAGIGTTATAPAASSTSAYGKPSTASRFHSAMSSTISTRTRAITSPPTSNSCPAEITKGSTTPSASPPTSSERAEGRPSCGPTGSPNRGPATSAVNATNLLGCEPSGAAPSVGRNISDARVVRLAQRAAVYDLTIEGAHEFFAGGLLVHNCDELGSWSRPDTFDQLRFALRIGETPQLVVTGTPRPTALMRSLTTRAAQGEPIVITRGATIENAPNLSAVALAELEERYGGTRLGRQELGGELLEDVEGALWKRADILIAASAPPLVRIMVGVDPSTWGEDTGAEHSHVGQGIETGMVVVGLSNENPSRCYVLEDLSGRHSPHEWGALAVRAQKHWQQTAPTWIVPETNAGGAMVTNTLRSVDPNARIYSENGRAGVHASKGKRARAEPVAGLYEQHRVSHVGSFEVLADQMCEWDASMPWSPDRVDALVWAVTALKPWEGGVAVATASERRPVRPAPGKRARSVGKPGMRGASAGRIRRLS